MKKRFLFILIAFITLTISIQAKSKWYNLTHVSYKWDTDVSFGEWIELDDPISMYWDFDKKHIIIYTEDEQILDYDNFKYNKTDTFENWSANATDTKYKRITVEIVHSLKKDNNNFIVISYSDFTYMYVISK